MCVARFLPSQRALMSTGGFSPHETRTRRTRLSFSPLSRNIGISRGATSPFVHATRYPRDVALGMPLLDRAEPLKLKYTETGKRIYFKVERRRLERTLSIYISVFK